MHCRKLGALQLKRRNEFDLLSDRSEYSENTGLAGIPVFWGVKVKMSGE
jgi:hypothetical protein